MKKRMYGLSAPGILGYMHISNAIINRTSNRNINMPFDNVHYYHTKLGNVCYLKFEPDKQKANRPLILLHDLYPGFSAEEWRSAAKILSKNRAVYALDLPGCGRSDKPKLSYTRYLYVQLLNHFVEDVTGNDVDIIASGGSFPSVILADRMNPDAFCHIIAVNPPSVDQTKHYPTYMDTLTRSALRSPIFGTYIYNMKFSQMATTDRLLRVGFKDPVKLSPQFAKLVYQSAHYDYQQAKYLYAAIASGYLNLDITESLRLYINKLYFVMGGAYPNYRKVFQSYQDQVSNAGLAVIGDAAKYPHIETCEKFCRIIERLLDHIS